MNIPLVSILVPVYRVEKYIERCAVSLFEQTYPNIEYVFVDDCSNDKSIEILQNTISNYSLLENRIKIVRHNCNKGLKASRNTAVVNATGEFIIHVDSDDYIEADTVEQLINIQRTSDYDIVACDYNILNGKSITRKSIKDCDSTENMLISILRKVNEPTTWGRLIRLSLYKDNNLKWDENSLMSEDWQMTPRLYYFAKKTTNIHIPLFNYTKENELSATAVFNPEKLSADAECIILFDFFADKEPIYLDALCYGHTRMVLSGLISLSTKKTVKVFYEKFIIMLYGCKSQYISMQGKKYVMVSRLARAKRLLALYVQIGLCVNKIARKLK